MLPADKAELTGIARLEHDPNWELFLNWLRRSLDSERKRGNTANELVEIGRSQGRITQLETILDKADKARDELARIRENEKAKATVHPNFQGTVAGTPARAPTT